MSRGTISQKNSSNKRLTPAEFQQLNEIASGKGHSDGLTRAPIRYFWGRHGHEVIENLIRQWNGPGNADTSGRDMPPLSHRTKRTYEEHSGARRGNQPSPANLQAIMATGMDDQDWVPRGKWPEVLDGIDDVGSGYRTSNIVQSTFEKAYRVPDHQLSYVDPAMSRHTATQVQNTVNRHKPVHALHLLAYTPNRREEGHVVENFSSKGEKNYNAEHVIRSAGTLDHREEWSHQPHNGSGGGGYAGRRGRKNRSVHRGFYGTGQRAAVQMLK